MRTLHLLTREAPDVPMSAAWYLADVGEANGRQELFTRQSPQRLKALREHALIESAVSSNRIEGVEIAPSRFRPVVLGGPPLQDRNEEEVRGYRDALRRIHESARRLAVSEEAVLELHRLSRAGIGDAGHYRQKDLDIIEIDATGSSRVRFKAVAGTRVGDAMRDLVAAWDDALDQGRLHPLLLLAAFNLDFLCIHPFRDGNGRVSRLLLLLQCYQFGFEVGRYISLERIIEENKERYYETLEQSSQGWHEGRHDPWPYVTYLLFILKTAYREFEDRAAGERPARGSKTELVSYALEHVPSPFGIADVERLCPNVSRAMIRVVMNRWRKEGRLEVLGRGRDARWRRLGG